MHTLNTWGEYCMYTSSKPISRNNIYEIDHLHAPVTAILDTGMVKMLQRGEEINGAFPECRSESIIYTVFI
jgi:hypothetical protein